MARAEVRLSKRALAQLDAIAEYIARQHGLPRTALDYIDRIRERCWRSVIFPGPAGLMQDLPAVCEPCPSRAS